MILKYDKYLILQFFNNFNFFKTFLRYRSFYKESIVFEIFGIF